MSAVALHGAVIRCHKAIEFPADAKLESSPRSPETTMSLLGMYIALTCLQSSSAAYLSLGDLAEVRFQAPGSLMSIKRVKGDMEAVMKMQNNDLFKLEAYDTAGKFKVLLAEAQDAINEHKVRHTTAFIQPLKGELSILRCVAKGGAAGESWKARVPESSTFSMLIDLTVETMQKVDKNKLTVLIKSVLLVFK